MPLDTLAKQPGEDYQISLAKDAWQEWSLTEGTRVFLRKLVEKRNEILKNLEDNSINLSEHQLRARITEAATITKTINLVNYGRYDTAVPSK